jgi:hypothetical protein
LGGNTMHAMAAGALVFFVSEVSMARSYNCPRNTCGPGHVFI